MKLEVQQLDDGIKKIDLIGRLDIAGTGEIEMSFISHTATQKAPVLVDMSGVEFIASIGVRLLVSNAKALARRGGKMVLLNPAPFVENVLVTSGISNLIPIFHDFEAACESLKTTISD